MRTLIVDDEPLARRGILARLKTVADIEVVNVCANGREAVEAIQTQAPDLVFLDVQMPGMDGFDVVQAVGPKAMPVVIFVTAFDVHALRAFDVHALDYLLKPIDDERFFRALDRARDALEQRKTSALGRKFADLLENYTNGDVKEAPEMASDAAGPVERFVIKSGGRIFFVYAAEIDWVEAAGDYVCLHVGAKKHLMRETMTAMEKKLDPAQFVRIHRSTIVNTEAIQELRPYANGEYIVILHDGTELKLSRSYRDRLDVFFDGAL